MLASYAGHVLTWNSVLAQIDFAYPMIQASEQVWIKPDTTCARSAHCVHKQDEVPQVEVVFVPMSQSRVSTGMVEQAYFAHKLAV